MFNQVDFMKADATNTYRTKHYIVSQCCFLNCTDGGAVAVSEDTYFLRTRKRDCQYEEIFKSRKHINGKRVATTMYSKKYVD